MKSFEPEFIKKLKHQDHATFNSFYLQTVDSLFRYVEANYYFTHQDAEDLISDFYVKFREGVKKYDEKQSFSGYFRVIFKNLIKDQFKKNENIPFTHLDGDDEDLNFEDSLVDEEDMTELLEQDFQFDQIKKAMGELDDVSRDIIYRKFIEEKENDEIQSILGISNDNLRQKSSRAMKQLKSILNK